MRVGNGLTCRFWTDNWSSFGCLEQYFSQDSNFSLRIPAAATLSSLQRDGNWRLPHARSERQLNLQAYLTTVQLTEEEDHYVWEIEGTTSTRYSTSAIYSCLYGEGEVVPWDQIVWIAGGIPKQSFLCWLFVLNRCPTRDRLLRWGLQTPPTCLLCNLAPESRDHLFFSCTYAWELWLSQSRRSGLDPQRIWDAVITQLQAFSSRSWRAMNYIMSQLAIFSFNVALRLLLGFAFYGRYMASPQTSLVAIVQLCQQIQGLQAPSAVAVLNLLNQVIIYSLWREQNARIFKSLSSTQEALFGVVDCAIRDRLLSLSRPTVSAPSPTLLELYFWFLSPYS
ncbi:hypothetical protein IGI04_018450 [Brassica rapa subsp. trilocularis]|uniref:Reverse transcriptase zinc-binding domain-containing protein n=1 Tax=Brassica rapa subsp. trilocularis TaxID=1813537 RepID=A0ABQ7MGJ3_BRACM|nr:hypothetical protein IGI04_018450 [Brassica rapa subsp. trilocularis]